ncbi:MAG: sulfotransferase, partial [Parvularculaceae bacterium]
ISGELLAAAPSDAAAHALACEIAIAAEEPRQALEHISRAVELEPEQPGYLLTKARVELMNRRGLAAQASAAAAAALAPKNPAYLFGAARIFIECDNPRGASPLLLKARGLGASDPPLLYELARSQFYLGEIGAGEATVTEFLKRAPAHGDALLLRSRMRKQTPARNHIEALRALAGQSLPWKEAVRVQYALAKEYEDLGLDAEAFAAVKAGAALQRRRVGYDHEAELQNIDNLIATFTPEAFASIRDGFQSDAPIFILGLPRTGTTLVERIISGHEDVKSAGETIDFMAAMSSIIDRYIAERESENLNTLSAALCVDYRAMGERYVENVHGMIGESRRFIDKAPFNFLYCGLIGKALPNARIIHLVRHPADTCFAIFKTLFNQAYLFSYNLEELADYYIAYRRLMDHWRALMPQQILDVSYEKLVSDPEAESKRIMDFCGLDWSPDLIRIEERRAASSTASAAQIREPIYTSSIDAWRRHEAELRLRAAEQNLER